MLTALRLGNFKAFSDAQTLPIKPLTLIFGANSGGKSSLIHGLLLARHALDTGEFDVFRTRIGGDSVDLGGFRQYVHRHSGGRRVEWRAELDASRLQGRARELLASVKRLSIALQIGVELDDREAPVPGSKPRAMVYELEADGRSILRLSRRPENVLQLDRLDPEAFRPITEALMEAYTTVARLRPEDFCAVDAAIADLLPAIRFTAGGLLPGPLKTDDALALGAARKEFIPVSKASRRADLTGAVRLLIPRTMHEMLEGVNRLLTEELGRLRYLGPLRSFPPRHLAFLEEHDPNWFAGGGYAWEVVRQDPAVREKVNVWLSAPDRLQMPYRLTLRRFISPADTQATIAEEFCTLLQELETGAACSLEDQNAREKRAIRGARFDGEEKARALVQKLLRNREGEGFEDLVLEDLRTNTVVSHRDVGTGISQVLPVLVHAYADRGRIVAVEQPEIHLHPALQAELGDLFIESALGDPGNCFLLETHSEHLILRILRRVRETTEGRLAKGQVPARPEDLAVLFVQPGPKGAEVIELPVTSDGDFARPWPGGFFAERFKDLP